MKDIAYSIVHIPPSDLLKDHEYGANYRDDRTPVERAAMAEALRSGQLVEYPWAILVNGKYYHAAGDGRLAAMLDIGMTSLPYRVVEPRKCGMTPKEACVFLRAQSDLVKPLSFAERVRMSRQLRSVYKTAVKVGRMMHLTDKYLKALWALDAFLPPGWEGKLNAEQALYVSGLGSVEGAAAYAEFEKSGKFPPRKKSEKPATGRKAARDKWIEEIAREKGDWVRAFPWDFVAVPKSKRDEFLVALDGLQTAVLAALEEGESGEPDESEPYESEPDESEESDESDEQDESDVDAEFGAHPGIGNAGVY